jgi:DNA-3-methyladenine glycosylase I
MTALTTASGAPGQSGFDPLLPRCPWAMGGKRQDPLMVRYHDEEWGTPVTGDVELFERLVLESFQAGLSWSTILHKREAFRSAFRGFEPAAVAAFGPEDRERLLGDAGIVRNRAKVDATIRNAAAFLRVLDEFGSFDGYLRRFVPAPNPPWPAGTGLHDIPPTTPESDALSRDLRRRGFAFVGSTIVYAFMESVGLVDDHLAECFRYRGQ